MNRLAFIAGAIAVLLLTACSTLMVKPETPRVSLVGLTMVSLELFEQRYQVRLRIVNPNDFELPIHGIDFHLDINGEDFADGVSNQAVTIPAFGEQVVEMDISSSLLQVFRQLQLLDNKELTGFEYRITGSVASGSYGRRLPFDFEGRLDAQKKPAPGEVRNRKISDKLSTNSVDKFVDELPESDFLQLNTALFVKSAKSSTIRNNCFETISYEIILNLTESQIAFVL